MYDLCYCICSSIKLIMWDAIKHAEPVLQFCSKFDLKFLQFIGINLLRLHSQFISLKPCVDLGSSSNHSVITACVYAIEHLQIREDTMLVCEDVVNLTFWFHCLGRSMSSICYDAS